MTQRIGILGGTFDPVHVGHLVLAACARDQLQTDRFLLIPNAHSPLKAAAPVAEFADRLHMLRLAIAGTDGLEASDLEGQRGGTSYTIDTLRALSPQNPGGEFFLVLGSDALAEFSTWKDHEGVLALAQLAAARRGAEASITDSRLGQSIQMPRLDVSSTLLRQRVAAGETIDFLTPPPVAAFIRARGLYLRP
ncbi:MAG: nicotinate (nicotinamide) nucleotide adenylyltransferase [candidate division Zixibacteria bacterium]|nr:nicotinate (nicotinamide) nucleotide adenylyltransferase [candidate division Zixibacteria bacterium]